VGEPLDQPPSRLVFFKTFREGTTPNNDDSVELMKGVDEGADYSEPRFVVEGCLVERQTATVAEAAQHAIALY
jgi:hypothetical protein